MRGERIVWVVRRMEIDFRAPARIDDILTIDTRTEEISGARIVMAQQIRRGGELLIEARVEAAIIGENGRPRAFRDEWIAAFLPQAPEASLRAGRAACPNRSLTITVHEEFGEDCTESRAPSFHQTLPRKGRDRRISGRFRTRRADGQTG